MRQKYGDSDCTQRLRDPPFPVTTPLGGGGGSHNYKEAINYFLRQVTSSALGLVLAFALSMLSGT